MNAVEAPSTIVVQKIPVAKDSLKFAGLEKKFNIVDVVPSSDTTNDDGDPQYSAKIDEIISTLKALSIAKKSLSDVQSITKDIKSSYKTETNDAWAPLDDSMKRQRYEAVKQIQEILKNAKYNDKNVFTMDYSDKDVKLDLQRKDVSQLNFQDELSINIFSDNIDKLGQQIEENIKKLQDKIDKIEDARWLSMEKLRNVRLEQKAVNEGLKQTSATTPSLIDALAQVTSLSNSVKPLTQNAESNLNPLADSKKTEMLQSVSQNPKTSSSTQAQSTKNTNNATPTNSNQIAKDDNAQTQGKESTSNIATNQASSKEANQTQTNQNNSSSQNNQTQTSNQQATPTNNTTPTNTANPTTQAKSEQNANTQATTQSSNATNATTNVPASTNTNATTQANSNQTANNTSNESPNNNVVGVVSGNDKEKVVDLFV